MNPWFGKIWCGSNHIVAQTNCGIYQHSCIFCMASLSSSVSPSLAYWLRSVLTLWRKQQRGISLWKKESGSLPSFRERANIIITSVQIYTTSHLLQGWHSSTTTPDVIASISSERHKRWVSTWQAAKRTSKNVLSQGTREKHIFESKAKWDTAGGWGRNAIMTET